jgi:peptidoglycan/xylan/chitin deacetylase (PgdA/CDA1 family)
MARWRWCHLTNKCADMRSYSGAYLHIAYSGSNKFSVAMQQHNSQCNEKIAPFPETWDSLEAARYASATDIYMPINHFNINLTRSVGFALKGFYTTEPTTISKIEIVDKVPNGWIMPSKLPSGRLVFACTRPNSFALAIDDGDPTYAQRVMDMINQANVPVTFFTVGLPLLDSKNGLAKHYKDMAARGHQIALHSYTHPKMEGLADTAAIDWEINNDIGAVKQVFGDNVSKYFRPPFGTEGARMRQRLAANLGGNPYIVNWSVDVEDWIWAESSTPQKQLEAFKRDLAKGGNLVVMHYLYSSTVELIPEFIKLAKATGKKLMRVDQCMEDPNAPPLK